MRRAIAILLALALLCPLAACGAQNEGPFRTLETLGKREYHLIYRLNDRIIPQVEDAMARLNETGELSAISVRWLGHNAIALTAGAVLPTEAAEPEQEPGPEASPAEDAPAETPVPEEDEAPARRLIVGIEADAAPLCSVSAAGTLQGMSVDIAAALGRALGCEIAYQPIASSEVGTQLASGNIDCALGFDPATVRADRYSVGVGYMESEVIVAVRRESEVKRLSDVEGQRIGTVSDPTLRALVTANENVTRYASGATVYLSVPRCIKALDNGWCAAVALDRLILENATL